MICEQVGMFILLFDAVFKTQIKKKTKLTDWVAFTRQLGKPDKY